MAENYKHLYHQTKLMLEKYQDEIVPGLREQLEKRVEVVRCKDCVSKDVWIRTDHGRYYCGISGMYPESDNDFCSYGERK
jgi:hypothetical protein